MIMKIIIDTDDYKESSKKTKKSYKKREYKKSGKYKKKRTFDYSTVGKRMTKSW